MLGETALDEGAGTMRAEVDPLLIGRVSPTREVAVVTGSSTEIVCSHRIRCSRSELQSTHPGPLSCQRPVAPPVPRTRWYTRRMESTKRQSHRGAPQFSYVP